MSVLLVIAVLLTGMAAGYLIVSLNAVTYSNADDIPYNRTGLLLGTSPITPQGGITTISTLE